MPAQFDGVTVTEMQYEGVNIVEAMIDGEIVWSANRFPDLSFLEDAQVGPIRVAFAGSSTTQGFGGGRNESYAHVLTARFVRHVADVNASRMISQTSGSLAPQSAPGFHFLNVGLGGTNAGNYIDGARASLLFTWQPHLLMHMIGSNDYFEQRNLSTYKNDLRARINALPDITHILVHSYRRRDRADTGITWAQYGAAMEEVASEFPNVGFIDVSEAWEYNQAPGVSYMMADNVHATWQGNELLANVVADALEFNFTYGETIWATDAGLPVGGAGILPPTPESRVQMNAVSPNLDTQVVRFTDAGVPTYSFNNSGVRYADTPPWGMAAAMPMAFFVVVNSHGNTANETLVAPFFSRSNAPDDGWWWAWRDKDTFEYRAALNSAFSPPAIRTHTLPYIIGVHMKPNNRAQIFISSAVGIQVGPEQIDTNLGPWMKSLRLGANSGLNNRTSMRMREMRFETAPMEANGFMSQRMQELGTKHGISIFQGNSVLPFSVSTTTNQTVDQGVWTTLHETVVVGSGSAVIDLAWRFSSTSFNSISHLRAIRLVVNGVVVGGWDHGGTRVMASAWQSTATQTRTLQHGDVVRMDAYGDNSSSALRTVTERSFSITPN